MYDTSALYALLVAEDRWHTASKAAFAALEAENASLVTSSFVLQETVSLLQARTGLVAVRRFHDALVPLLEIAWVDRDLYRSAMTALVAANRRRVSITDWLSFEIMRRQGIDKAFAVDAHFVEQGFSVLPESETSSNDRGR